MQSALTHRTDTRGERFQMTVDGRHVDARTDAAALIARWAASATPEQNMPVGTLGGLQIDGAIRIPSGTHERRAELTLHELPSAPATLELSRLSDSPLSLIRQLEHRLEDLPHLADRLQERREQITAELDTARAQLTRPFTYAPQLADARADQARIEQTMTSRAAGPTPDPPPVCRRSTGSGPRGVSRAARAARRRRPQPAPWEPHDPDPQAGRPLRRGDASRAP